MNELYSVLQSASLEQRRFLAVLVECQTGENADHLCRHLRSLRAETLGQRAWLGSWKQLVTDVADQIRIDWLQTLSGDAWHEVSTMRVEAAVVETLFRREIASLTPERRQRLLGGWRSPGQFHSIMPQGGAGFAHDAKISVLSGGPIGIDLIGIDLIGINPISIDRMASMALHRLVQTFGLSLPAAPESTANGALNHQAIAPAVDSLSILTPVQRHLYILNSASWQRLVLAVVYVVILRSPRPGPNHPSTQCAPSASDCLRETLRQARRDRASREHQERWPRRAVGLLAATPSCSVL